VEFWADRYPPGYLAIYNREIQRKPAESLRGLWRWKTLHRTGFDPEQFDPYIREAEELCDSIDESVSEVSTEKVADAFGKLRKSLKQEGPLSQNSRVIVTPQFLLHLADSKDGYSGRFPILDVMVARAYRTWTASDTSKTLQATLAGSRNTYIELVEYILGNCETASQVAQMERALFVQGRAIAQYRENEAEYDKIRKLPVSVAREYLDDIREHTHP